MSGGNRSEGTAALVAQPRDKAGSGQEAADRNQQIREEASAVTPPIKQDTTPNDPAVAGQKAQSEQPGPYDLRDVIAQEIMADAAVWMAAAAFLTFFVTSLGTLLIWRQVKLTRKAVADTGKATLAMEKANKIARESNRPWVHLEIQEEGKLWIETGKITLKADVILTNYGALPALEIWSDGVLSFDKAELVLLEQSLAGAEATSSHARTALFPKKSEGTQLELEFDREIPRSGNLHLLTYCKYRVPGETDWHHTADIHEVRAGEAATRFYGMDGEKMIFSVPMNALESRTVKLKRPPGLFPTMT